MGISVGMAASETWPLREERLVKRGVSRGWLVTLKAYETFISA